MRLMIMFDLPVDTTIERRAYRQFRKSLEREGFLMVQYSVYVRVCPSRQSATFLENRVKQYLPEEGLIQSLMITEKQYQDMHFLIGSSSTDLRNSAERMIII